MSHTAVVIDDSNTSRIALKAALVQSGIRVVGEGTTGEEAVPLYEKHRPTLLLLDIVLPELDGVSAAKAVLGQFPAATVVMCSSLTARDKILECRDAGVRHFILKPASLEKVRGVIKQVLTRLSAPSESQAV